MAVPARPEDAIARAFDRAAGDEGAGARGLDAVEVDECRRVRKRGHHTGLRRHLDEVAATGGFALVECNQRSACGLRAGPGVGLRLADAHRHAVGLASERHGAACRHDLDIASLPSAARSRIAERAYRNNDEPRISGAQTRRDRATARCPCTPLPLVGRGRGWGSAGIVPHHPPPQPSPTRGEGAPV